MTYQLLKRRVAGTAASPAPVPAVLKSLPEKPAPWMEALPGELRALLEMELSNGNRVAYVTGAGAVSSQATLVVLERPFVALPRLLPRGVNRLPWWSGWWQSAYCTPSPLCILAAGPAV